MKLSERIMDFRCERPSEFLMDDFARDAVKLESRVAELEAAIAKREAVAVKVVDGELDLWELALDMSTCTIRRDGRFYRYRMLAASQPAQQQSEPITAEHSAKEE